MPSPQAANAQLLVQLSVSIRLAEECDDGNLSSGDGCSGVCLIESGFVCTGEPSNCVPDLINCGDAFVQTPEECDDGNSINGDSCDNDCTRSRVIQVEAGNLHTCALLDTGLVFCWGDNSSGQLGYGNTQSIGDNELPKEAGPVNVGAEVTQLALGLSHTCALLKNGGVRCWGSSSQGQLGYENFNNIGDQPGEMPPPDINVGGVVTQITAGGFHTCALLNNGNVRCWGFAADGRLGNQNTNNNIGDQLGEMPPSNINIGGFVLQVESGSAHNCALLDSESVRCWGLGSSGQLGYGNTSSIGDNEPPANAGDSLVAGSVAQIAVGAFHSCALSTNGEIQCWGDNSSGQLGYGNTTTVGDNETPSSAGFIVLGGVANSVFAGDLHTCAPLLNGSLKCWGNGLSGQLGIGQITLVGDNEFPANAPNVLIPGTVSQVAGGGAHTCAIITSTDSLRCWGLGSVGQLGYGDLQSRTDASSEDVPIF